MNAEHLQELDIQLGAIRIECHRIDYGPGGLIAALRRVVYRELGLPPPAEPDDLRVDVEAVRDALRSFNVPSKLAQSPLAGPGTVQERAESVRRRLIEAAEVAFGTSESEQLLRRVLVLGYLHPAQNHARAALDLSMSRASYFRRLKLASERLAEQLSAGAD